MESCCNDSSLFVADPLTKGTGPGGLAIICSAVLKGNARNILGGILMVGKSSSIGLGDSADNIDCFPDGVQFLCCDQGLQKSGGGGTNVESSLDVSAQTALEVLSGSAFSAHPSKPRLSYIAALAAVFVGDTVLIESLGQMDELVRGAGEKRSSFFERVVAKLKTCKPTSSPKYLYRAAPIGKLVVIGGEMDLKDAASIMYANRTCAEKSAVLIANIRSNQERFEVVTTAHSGSYVSAQLNTGDVVTSMGRALAVLDQCPPPQRQ
jgi:hypothetical protein